MAEGSRFASLKDNAILKIIDDKDVKATKNVIAGANITDVSGTLRKFYAEIRKTDGKLYALRSLI